MNMEELLLLGENTLLLTGITEAKLDAWYLMEYCFHLNRVSFWVNSKRIAAKEEEVHYLDLIHIRGQHVPLQYITNEQEFMGLKFLVTKDVLIPRQDTECLVETVLMHCENREVLDLCTGSGCIAISLSLLGKTRSVSGADISKRALDVAKKNGKQNGALIEWIHSDLFASITKKYDIIVSNPPYIESKVVDELMPEVRQHEPRIALDGKEDGLYFYREIIKKAENFLNAEGKLFFEIGYNQGEEVKQLLEQAHYKDIELIKDLCGLDRVVYGVCKG